VSTKYYNRETLTPAERMQRIGELLAKGVTLLLFKDAVGSEQRSSGPLRGNNYAGPSAESASENGSQQENSNTK
jgi:hypothetical protein